MKLKPILMSMILPAITFAGEGHTHEAAVETAPKGGLLRDAPPYKTELVINGDEVKMYIYDKNLKVLKPDQAELRGEVQFPREKRKGILLKLSGDYYTAKISGISKAHRFDLHIPFKLNGKSAIGDFGVDNQ